MNRGVGVLYPCIGYQSDEYSLDLQPELSFVSVTKKGRFRPFAKKLYPVESLRYILVRVMGFAFPSGRRYKSGWLGFNAPMVTFRVQLKEVLPVSMI